MVALTTYLPRTKKILMTQSLLPARHYNAYHQKDSLLFQFILSELISVHREIHGLTLCLEQNESKLLGEKLGKLVGSSQDFMRLFSWNLGDGMLFKLKNYCALFSHNADTKEKEPLALLHYAEKLWAHCLQTLEAFREAPIECIGLKIPLEKTMNSVNRFSKLIARLIPQFRDDENVLFYIVRHHTEFDALYGPKFTYRLMHRLFQKGLKEAKFFLTKKYKDRGFDNLLPAIDGLISELEAK